MASQLKKGATGTWFKSSKAIKGILLDMSGVMFEGGDDGGHAIPGSVDAVKRLRDSGIPVRFCTNESQLSNKKIAARINGLGYDVKVEEIFAPSPAMYKLLKERGLRPHLLVHKESLAEFNDIDQTNPNCVVMGDAVEDFSFANMNKAFQTLVTMQNPILFSLGRGKYYKEAGSLHLDVGPFMAAIEYACDIKAEIVGKPSKTFFLTAVKDMGIQPEETLMIGDDIVNDVGGAQACGLMGVQVRTGKFRPSEEPHPTVVPDGYVDDLAQAVDVFLKHR